MAGERLVKIMLNAAKPDKSSTTDMLYGTVTSTDPLKVKIDSRFEVTEEFLLLSPFCVEKKVTLPTEGSPEVVLWPGLAENDTVRILRVNSGQSFYILEVVV